MLLDHIPFEIPIHSLHLLFAAGLGLVFGIAAQVSRFCLRRAVVGDSAERGQAGAVWMVALGVAVASFAIAQTAGWVDLEGHRLLEAELPALAIVVGGLIFGAGMVLARGCASRLTILAGTGNLRALSVLVVFALVAQATAKGVLSPLREALGAVRIDTGILSLAEVPGAVIVAVLALLVGAAVLARQASVRPRDLALGAVIGVLPVLGWIGTSVALVDDFDPLPVQSLAFTLPWIDTLFWAQVSSAVPAGFGVGMIAGVLAGAFLSAALRGEVQLQSFESPRQTLRYSLGGALMGAGGVLAGGCTVGAGLAGGASLSIAALLALAAIIAGALATRAALAMGPAPQPA